MGIIGSFFGSDQKRHADAGLKGALEQQGLGRAAWETGGREAQGYIAPWLDRGGRRMYDATLGLNGADPNEANKAYFSNDADQEQLRLQQKERGWMSNSRGGYGTATDSLAAARINAQNYGNWQNRLAGVAAQEQGAAGTASNIALNTAGGIAGTYGQGGQAYQDWAKARMANDNTGIQNMLGLGQTIVGGFTPGRSGTSAFGNMASGASQFGNNLASYFR